MLKLIQQPASLGLLPFCAITLFLTFGCSTEEPSSEIQSPAKAAEPSPMALAALAEADAADGTTDKVVRKCLACKLAMNGKSEHQTTYGEYTMHFCTELCKMSFEKDPEKALLSLN
ncbi:MAG: hypothetical protein ACWGQW_10600 [bacterium]